MEIVINTCYGGFSVSEEAAKFFNMTSVYGDIDRQDPMLIEKVKENPKWVSSRFANLKVVDIPDEATDWDIDAYDGLERIIYVLNGKINYIH